MKELGKIKIKIRKLEPTLKKRFNVKKIGLFGSYIVKKQKRGSDLDVLVEFYRPIGLFDFVELEDFLSGELGIKVDLTMKDALKLRIKESILQQVVYV